MFVIRTRKQYDRDLMRSTADGCTLAAGQARNQARTAVVVSDAGALKAFAYLLDEMADDIRRET